MRRLALGLLAVAAISGIAAAQPAPVSDVSFADAMAGRTVQLVLVKDWIKIENTGGLAKVVEFERYCPIADDEQLVLGRWVSAKTEGGTELPADLSGAREDGGANIVQTVRVRPMPPGQRATVTLTTLVARRERAKPSGKFPIPPRDSYPKLMRAYLDSTPMVAVDDPYVQRVAKEILSRTNDAYEVAAEIAAMAKKRTYLPSGNAEARSVAAGVLQNGGSCCASAVAAAAVLRACGVPAQVTYCPAGYVHGVVRFWLKDYGWVRMDATSGTGDLPLIQMKEELGLVRLFDTPLGMEQQPMAYAWPYEHNDDDGPLMFKVDGERSGQVRMADSSGSELPWVQEPVPHLEPGSWNVVLGSEAIERFAGWDDLVRESRELVKGGKVGAFGTLVAKLGAGTYADLAGGWGTKGK